MADSTFGGTRKVTFRLTPSEVDHHENASMSRPRKLFSLLLLGGLACATIVIVATTAVRLRREGLVGWQSIRPLPDIVLVAAAAAGFLLWQRRLRASALNADITVLIDPAGVAARQGGIETTIPWSSVTHVRDDHRLIRFLLDDRDPATGQRIRPAGSAILVPVRVFASRAQADSFVEEARRWHASARDQQAAPSAMGRSDG